MLAMEFAKYLSTPAGGNLVNYQEAEGGDVGIGFQADGDVVERWVMFKDTPGDPGDMKLGYDSPRVQVLVRGTTDPVDASDRARAIYSQLHGLHSVTLSDGTWVVGIRAISLPGDLGPDPNGRYEYSINFEAEVRSLTANRE